MVCNHRLIWINMFKLDEAEKDIPMKKSINRVHKGGDAQSTSSAGRLHAPKKLSSQTVNNLAKKILSQNTSSIVSSAAATADAITSTSSQVSSLPAATIRPSRGSPTIASLSKLNLKWSLRNRDGGGGGGNRDTRDDSETTTMYKIKSRVQIFYLPLFMAICAVSIALSIAHKKIVIINKFFVILYF